MTPARLHRIRAVYEAAVDSPAAARQALLDHECEGDEELRKEVEHLLGARENLPGWLAGPVLGVAHAAVLEADSTVTYASAGHMPFAPGMVLAQRYRIVHLLGRGGMGEVYSAHDLLLGQLVALKFLSREATASASALDRFRNEVRTARQVSHPNVCRVYDIGEADGLTYLSMEYVDGEDLASLLRRIGRLPQEKALEIARQLCAGLATAHEKGVIHRDLKPANIMLDGRGQVRITDFGIAGVAEQIRDVRSGTPAYMLPEQLAQASGTVRKAARSGTQVFLQRQFRVQRQSPLLGAKTHYLRSQADRRRPSGQGGFHFQSDCGHGLHRRGEEPRIRSGD